MFPGFKLFPGPKHSISVPFKVRFPVPLSVDEKEVKFLANPVRGVALKASFVPQVSSEIDLCVSEHSLLPPPTLQMVIPFLFPVTVHLNVKVSPGQAGGALMNCPAATSEQKIQQ